MAELAYLHVEIRNQLFHLSKNIVKTLQERDVIPGDFEYKRYATHLSVEPEAGLLARFEDVFASIHTQTNAVAVSVFEQTKRILGSRLRRFWFPFRMIVPSSLTVRWAHARKMAFLGRSLVGWYYWLIWHTLPQRRRDVELRLAGRKENARAELSDIEAQSNQFLNASSGISTDLGVLLGAVGVGITVVFGGLQFNWPAYVILTGAVFIFALAAKSFFGILRNVRLMNADATAICQVFRWDHEISPKNRDGRQPMPNSDEAPRSHSSPASSS